MHLAAPGLSAVLRGQRWAYLAVSQPGGKQRLGCQMVQQDVLGEDGARLDGIRQGAVAAGRSQRGDEGGVGGRKQRAVERGEVSQQAGVL